MSTSNAILQRFERLDGVSQTFGDLYSRLFYEHVVERELGIADPDEQATVLQIGCGPLPMTAITLAERGYDVVAVDIDPDAVGAARDAISERELTDKIDIVVSDGCTIDTSGFDVIWLAFHVAPRSELVDSTVSSLEPDQTLVYRRPRSWARAIFPSDSPPIPDDVSLETVTQRFGKESVVVCHDPGNCADCDDAADCPASDETPARTDSELVADAESAGPTLDSLQIGERATIRTVPDHDLLPSLGVRPGKDVRLETGQAFNGPLVVTVDERTVALDRTLAGRIRLESTPQGRTEPTPTDGF
ncbi:FeoA domain-containing protein [Natronobacterium gregoryi]|uniref:FeoA domain-containing protein n=1 Tax=Natronobacterium gregoryi TaxID=44930 RepID=UPI001E459D64|nr:FeoA domain-containing protein [Natronobacterium gregoryi]